LNKKQRNILRRLFQTPTPADIPWDDIISLFEALGATIKQGRGSRIRVTISSEKAIFHEPQPRRQARPDQVRAVRRFLEQAGVIP
jgi:hypothetical protein